MFQKSNNLGPFDEEHKMNHFFLFDLKNILKMASNHFEATTKF